MGIDDKKKGKRVDEWFHNLQDFLFHVPDSVLAEMPLPECAMTVDNRSADSICMHSV